ncbi:MAG: transporter [Betaproteobacteria bacterium]|nr:transporter [Betaproteobacteria bacterium]
MVSASKHLMLRIACLVLLASFLGGCATGRDPRDPLEPFNRGVYQFNETLDKAILKPTAQAYRFVVPQFIRASVSNFFSNINDVVVALNNLLQGKFTAAYSDLGRIAINSTLGLGGLFDVASEAGIEKHNEDFGQTLGYWGIGDGPFVMLPFFGPSTGRDMVGRVADHYADVVTYVDPSSARNQLWGTQIVSRRAELLDASTVLQTAALDPYEFVRDAYLQRRRNLIHDGSPPPDREFMDPPPAPKTTINTPNQPPILGESTGYGGAVLVSGDARTPVLSGIQPAVDTAARPAQRPAKAALPREITASVNAEAVTRTNLQTPEQAKPAPVAAVEKAQPTILVRLWRSLVQLIRI